MNSSGCTILVDGKEKQITCADVQVGDLMVVKENEPFSADLVVLGTSLGNGACFIETSSLDGEKNLKPKSAIPETLPYYNLDDLRIDDDIIFEAGRPT